MATGIYNIVIVQGADWSLRITLKDNGSARTITGFTFRMQIRKSFDDPDVLVSITTVNNGGITITSGAGGILTLALTNTVTAALEFGEGVYDLEQIDGSAAVSRVLQGKATLDREVTR